MNDNISSDERFYVPKQQDHTEMALREENAALVAQIADLKNQLQDCISRSRNHEYYAKLYQRAFWQAVKPQQTDHIWFQTFTGKRFQPLSIDPATIDIESVSKSLGHMARFLGHTPFHYSVAQHTLLMMSMVEPDLRPYVMIHDMAEAYIGDTPSPYKELVPALKVVEADVERIITALLFNLPWPWPDGVQEAVKLADLRMLATEKQQLLVHEPYPWLPLPEPFSIRIEEWSPRYAADTFLATSLRMLWRQG